MRQVIKSLLPYGLVERVILYRDFHRLGFSRREALQSTLSSVKANFLRSTRLNLLPNNSLSQLQYIVDVGANEGIWSLGVLALCQPEQLVVIEPSPEMQSTLKSRLINYPCVNFLNVAASSEKGITDLYVTSHSHNSSILKPKEGMNEFYNHGWDIKEKVSVPVDSLDNILSDLPEISLLKIDVQGNEKFVLQGAKNILSKTRYVILEITFFSHYKGDTLFPDLHEMMTNSGFYLQNIMIPMCKDGRSLWGDAIYVANDLTRH